MRTRTPRVRCRSPGGASICCRRCCPPSRGTTASVPVGQRIAEQCATVVGEPDRRVDLDGGGRVADVEQDDRPIRRRAVTRPDRRAVAGTETGVRELVGGPPAGGEGDDAQGRRVSELVDGVGGGPEDGRLLCGGDRRGVEQRGEPADERRFVVSASLIRGHRGTITGQLAVLAEPARSMGALGFGATLRLCRSTSVASEGRLPPPATSSNRWVGTPPVWRSGSTGSHRRWCSMPAPGSGTSRRCSTVRAFDGTIVLGHLHWDHVMGIAVLRRRRSARCTRPRDGARPGRRCGRR